MRTNETNEPTLHSTYRTSVSDVLVALGTLTVFFLAIWTGLR